MYRIGGPARFYVQVASVRALKRLVTVCEESRVPWVAIGRGSNLLVADEGYPGVVITLGRDFRICRYDEDAHSFCVGAGVPLSSVVQEAFRRSLAGFEFAVGTPGTVGGALRMNAGSRDEWIGSRVVSVTTLSPGKGLVRRDGDQIAWGYRSSSFASDEVIVECELSVEPADPFFIRGKMEASHARRKKTQPLSLPSCGSVFRNPEGAPVGALIEEAGLKGLRIGGAQLSEVHANFIVNTGDATARDVLELINLVKTKVYETYRIDSNRKSVPRVRVRRARATAALRAGRRGVRPPAARRANPRAAACRELRRVLRRLEPIAPFPAASCRSVVRTRFARRCRRCAWGISTAPSALLARRKPTVATWCASASWPRSCWRSVGGGLAVYYSNLFTIENVSVTGVEHLTATDMSELASVPAGTTLLRVDAAGIRERLLKDAWVDDVSVNRVFPNTLELAVTERTITAVVDVPTENAESVQPWAIASDGMWLMPIPDQNSEAGKRTSPKVYEDAAKVLHITDVPYGTRPEVGAYCSDANVNNALAIVDGMTTELAGQVKKVAATETESTTLTLESGVEIVFGTAENIRDKERVCLEIMKEHPDGLAYINVRVVDRPTWRAL